jgi:hypothetical protein
VSWVVDVAEPVPTNHSKTYFYLVERDHGVGSFYPGLDVSDIGTSLWPRVRRRLGCWRRGGDAELPAASNWLPEPSTMTSTTRSIAHTEASSRDSLGPRIVSFVRIVLFSLVLRSIVQQDLFYSRAQ